MKPLAIVVGGGPSPGINAVIFTALVQGEADHTRELEIADVSRIHFEGGSILGTSRVNPACTPADLRRVTETLGRLDVSYLLTIAGDDTAFGAARVAQAMPGRLALVHVPKTIDHDLPLPPEVPTFGFTTAVDLLARAWSATSCKTPRRQASGFFVTMMGRHAGHLTLGIAGAMILAKGPSLDDGALKDIGQALERDSRSAELFGDHGASVAPA